MTDSTLQKTALHRLHVELGAKMVPFAGYDMPVQYPLGVKKEHLHTRAAAGLFDVSHMGQVRLSGEGVVEALSALLPQDVAGLAESRQRYTLMLGEQGGILDDLMLANRGEDYLAVVNAACKQDDLAWMRRHLPASVTCELLPEQSLLALQGPQARTVLSRFSDDISEMVFMDTAFVTIADMPCWVSCSGYTGEDGFEISVADQHAETLARLLLDQDDVEAIGLGARDSLRLESGLCLYGHDMDGQTTPVEANLMWAIPKSRRPDGEKAGGYIGADALQAALASGPTRRRVLLDIDGRVPVREGANIVDGQNGVIGSVCSGGFGPSVSSPIAMAYINARALDGSVSLYADVRGKLIPVTVRKAPYITQRYVR